MPDPFNVAGVVSEKLGTSKLFMVLVVVLSVTIGVLFAFRHPYLECVETTKRRKMSKSAAITEGETALTGGRKTNGNDH